jgi:hypothetical protein
MSVPANIYFTQQFFLNTFYCRAWDVENEGSIHKLLSEYGPLAKKIVSV